MTIASWFRRGGSGAPPDDESLSVNEDGTFYLWRAVRTPAAGVFSGTLPPVRIAALTDLAAAAAAEGDVKQVVLPEAATETASAGGHQAEISGGTAVEGAWNQLFVELRVLSNELIEHPLAAIGIAVRDGGGRAQLVHLGSGDVAVNLDSIRLRAALWEDWYHAAGTWESSLPVLSDRGWVTASPGWSLELPFEHGLTIAAGWTLHATADVTLLVFGNEVAASIQHAPHPARPD